MGAEGALRNTPERRDPRIFTVVEIILIGRVSNCRKLTGGGSARGTPAELVRGVASRSVDDRGAPGDVSLSIAASDMRYEL